MKSKVTLLISSILVSLSGPAFSMDQPSSEPDKMHHHEMSETKGTRVINVVNEVINGKTRYSPAVFIVKLGEKVQFKIFNTTDQPHGFSIDEFKVQQTLIPKENTFEFIADKAGLFDVYCQYHPAHLRGQILVLE